MNVNSFYDMLPRTQKIQEIQKIQQGNSFYTTLSSKYILNGNLLLLSEDNQIFNLSKVIFQCKQFFKSENSQTKKDIYNFWYHSVTRKEI